MRKLPLLAMAAILLTPAAFAADLETLDEFDAGALQGMSAMLTSPGARAAAIKQDANAAKLSEQVKAAAGGDKMKEEEMYRVANDVFTRIMQEENGNMDRVEARLKAYAENPDSLGQSMTDSQKAAVRSLSSAPTGSASNAH